MRHAIPVLGLLLLACTSKEDPDESGDTDTGPVNPFEDHALFQRGFLNIAHRGGADLRPEETIVAFQHAVDLGVDVLELDVWSSSDGTLVCLHDDTVNRTTDGAGYVSNLTWAELSALDAGYWYTEDEGATYPYRGQGVHLASLDEVLATFPDELLSIEIKQQSPPIVDLLVADIDEAGARDRVVVNSFLDGPLAEFRAAAPDVLTSLAMTEGLGLYYLAEEDEADYVPPGWVLDAPTELGDIVLDVPTIEKAHRLGVHVDVWTIDDPVVMGEVIDMGADGIITNRPDLLADVMEQRGL